MIMAQRLPLFHGDSTLITLNGEEQERGKEFFKSFILIKKSFLS